MGVPDNSSKGRPLTAPSFARCTWPITGCLGAAEAFLGPERTWVSTNDVQSAYLGGSYARTRGTQPEGMEAMATRDSSEAVAWLAERSFNVELPPCAANEFVTASVLDVLLSWLEGTATQTDVHTGGHGTFKGVKLHGGVTFYTAAGHSNLIVEIETQTRGRRVYMTMLDAPPDGEFGLTDLVRQLSSKKAIDRSNDHGSQVIFPMIHLEEERDLDWILHMWTLGQDGQRTQIVRALQINRLRMNHEGVRAQSAAVMTMRMTVSIEPHPYYINRPFVLWIEEYGAEEPLFTAWLDMDSWKDPGGLK